MTKFFSKIRFSLVSLEFTRFLSRNSGAEFPNLEVETDIAGRVKIHEYFADSWGIVFSHPKDFTPG